MSSDLPHTKSELAAVLVLLLYFFNIIRNVEYSHIFKKNNNFHSYKIPRYYSTDSTAQSDSFYNTLFV